MMFSSFDLTFEGSVCLSLSENAWPQLHSSRLAQGTFSWPRDLVQIKHLLDPDQLQALVVFSWVKIGSHGVILSV